MFDVETYAIIKKRIASGIGGSTSGSAINDTEISEDTMLSSQKIVDTVCPPFSVSGPIVQCTPVENYELGVKVNITPVQEGEGDPSPENVRPIVGWDNVNVWRAGKNLLDWSKVSAFVFPAYGLSFEKKENSIRIFGTSTQNGYSFFNIATTTQSELYGKNFIFSWFTSEENVIKVYGLRTTSENAITINMNLTEGSSYDFTIQIAVGTEKLTSYEPYRGETIAVALGQTVYGGTLDVGTEDSERTVDVISLAVADMDNSESFPGWQNQSWITDYVENINQNALFAVAADYLASNADGNKKLRFNSNFTVYFVASALGYTQSQIKEQYPNLVFQFAFRRITPELFHPTSTQQILAISGTNTIYADAGDITVTGVSDPGAAIATLQDRLTALENNTLN